MTISGIMMGDEILPVLKIKHNENTAISVLLNSTGRQSNSHKNISDLLDNLLRGYDNSIRPDFGGESKMDFNLFLFSYCLVLVQLVHDTPAK